MLFGLLPLLAALGPLVAAFRGLYAFRIACVFIVGYAVIFLLGRSRWRAPDVWLAATTISIVVAGLLGMGAIAPGSDDPYSEFLSIVLGLCTALAGRSWQRRVPGLYLSLARGWVVAGLFTCAVAVGEIVTGIHLPGYVESAAPDPAATFGNPNAMAIFLVLACVWTIPVRRSSGAPWRAATGLLVLASGPMVYLANARLALVVWLLVVAWLAWRGLRRSNHGLAGLGESMVPLGVAIAIVAMTPHLLGYLGEIATPGSSGGVREQLTRQGLGFALDRGGLPTWPGSFESLMRDHGDLDKSGGLVNAHNMWVELLVQYGVVSLVLLIGWMVVCVVANRAARDETALAVAAMLVLGLVDSSSLDAPSTWAFVITLAAVARSPVRPITGAVAARETVTS